MSQQEQQQPKAASPAGFKFDAKAIGDWAYREVRSWSIAHFVLDAFVTMGLTTVANVAMGLGFWPTLIIAISIFGSLATGTHIFLRSREKKSMITNESDADRRMREVFGIFDKMYMINFSANDPQDMHVWRETCIVNLEETLQDQSIAQRFDEMMSISEYDDEGNRNLKLAKGRAFLKAVQSRLREQDIRTFNA